MIQNKLKLRKPKNPNLPIKLTFLDTLELEYCRLKNQVTATQRDAILLNLKENIDINHFNPNKYVYLRDEKTENI